MPGVDVLVPGEHGLQPVDATALAFVPASQGRQVDDWLPDA